MKTSSRPWFLIPFLLGLGTLGLVAIQRERAARSSSPTQESSAPPPRGSSGLRQIRAVTLKGPGGVEVRIPGSEPLVVNVWLQKCPDCMPRFNAARELVRSDQAWPTPIVNVAFGSADLDWARRYGVGDQLVIDPGAAIVNPLGIRTFTTLVIDTQGNVVHTGFVDQPDFLKSLEAALAKARQGGGLDSAPTPGQGPSPRATPRPLPAPVAEEPVLADPRVLFGIALLLAGVGGGVLALFSSGARGPGQASGPIQPWPEDIVAGGQRCASCAGRFDEPEQVMRCSGCEAPYHRSCAQRERTCATRDCGRRL